MPKSDDLEVEKDFETLWKLWKRKNKKKEALKKYKASKKKKLLPDHDTLVKAINWAMNEFKDREIRYHPYFSTWINQEGWVDYLENEDKADEELCPFCGASLIMGACLAQCEGSRGR